jgi:hypothetical protein
MTEEKIEIKIKRIKDLTFYVNENIHDPDTEKLIKIELNPLLGFKADDNTVALIIRVFYHYEGTEASSENTLLEIQVQNLYEIKDVISFVNKDNILILPEKSIISLLDLSISHTRALLSKNAAGTVYQDSTMPIFDAGHAARFFFPYMFSQPSSIEEIKGPAVNAGPV